MMDCLFCKIGMGEVPSEIIYEDGNAMAFLEISPSAPGHTMVIPKKHYGDFMDLPPNEAGDIFGPAQKVAKMLKKALGADHFTIGINSGKILGRHVDHFHIHVIPRFADDGGTYIQGVVGMPSEEGLGAIKDRILKANG